MQQARRLIALASDLGSAELVDLLGCVNNSFAYPAKADLLVLSSTVLKGSPAVLIEARAG